MTLETLLADLEYILKHDPGQWGFNLGVLRQDTPKLIRIIRETQIAIRQATVLEQSLTCNQRIDILNKCLDDVEKIANE